MLLDRKRINRWAKWVALILAVIFAAGFLFMGVGYGGAGFNLSELFTGNKSATVSETPAEKIVGYQATLAENPSDVNALIGIATVYQQNDDLETAATYLEKVIEVDPSQKDVYLRLANIYLNTNVADYAAAVRVLNKATAIDSNNADVYLKLGTAQNSLGHTEAALLAWQKYLRLDPNGDMASVVQQQIDTLSKKATTTTLGSRETETTLATP